MADVLTIIDYLATIGIAIMVIILSFLSTSIFIWTVNFCKSGDNKSVTKSLPIITAFVVLLFTISSCSYLIAAISFLITNNNNSYMLSICIGFYLLGQSMMIFLFSIRIDVTFKYTKLEYSKPIAKALKHTAIALLIFNALIMIIVAAEMWTIAYIAGLIWIILYIALSISLMILFIRKIEILMVDQLKMHQMSANVSSVQVTTKTDVTDRHQTVKNDNSSSSKINFILIKNALLVSVAICSSFICFITGIGIAHLIDPTAWNISAMFWYPMDCTISSICLYLLAGFNDKYYFKLCSKLHIICQQWKLKQLQNSHHGGDRHSEVENSGIVRMCEHKKESDVQRIQDERNGHNNNWMGIKMQRGCCYVCTIFGLIFVCKLCIFVYVLYVLIIHAL